MHRRLPWIVALLTTSTAALAESQPGDNATRTAATVERHFTTNALDRVNARADWYSLLRGSIEQRLAGRDGSGTISAGFEAASYDRYKIEDDRAFTIGAEATRKIGDAFELRGGLSYRIASKGDDLEIGAVVLGTRTLQQVAKAELQLGANLGGNSTLIVTISGTADASGATIFEPAILPPIKLAPDRDTLAASAALGRTFGDTTLRLAAALRQVRVEAIGFPPSALSFVEVTAKAEAVYQGAKGTTVALAAGFQMMRSAADLFTGTRPTVLAVVEHPLSTTLGLRGKLSAAFEAEDSNDPLASWVRRGEIELTYRPAEKLTFAFGAIGEIAENLLLENEERTRGLFVGVEYQVAKRLVLTARLDVARTFATVLDTTKKTLDAYVGLTTRL